MSYQFHKQIGGCILREFRDKDVEGIFALDSDPRVHRYLGQQTLTDLKQAQQTLEYIQSHYDQYGVGRWAIIDESNGDFVGWGGLKWETSLGENPYYDLGYRLRPEYWGRGIATRVSQVALHYGFEELGVDVIRAGVHQDNAASLRVLSKLGFRQQGPFIFRGLPCLWFGLKKRLWSQLQSLESV